VPETPISAALAAAAAHELPTAEPRILRDLTNVLVHLHPAPVVARVPITLARLRAPSWFEQEVELAAFLAAAGAPVAPPANGVDPGPHEAGDFLVSFWAYVDHDPDRFEAAAVGGSLRELHEELGRYPRPLPTCDRLDEVRTLLAGLEPDDLVSLEELESLRALASRLSPNRSGRPLHGDSHFRNVLWSPEGPLWTDLENACSGPIEYDLACLYWRNQPGTREALAAYGAFDERTLEEVTPLLVLFLAAWTILVARRVPSPGGDAEARRRIGCALDYVS
jgi:Ser/Thr protein kinase RdoA (MazF antagonist)